jgi:N-acetylmuramoyl-L-alanine amidase CwlA
MDQFLKAVYDNYFTEKDNIKWVLMMKDEAKNVDLSHFSVDDEYEVNFIPISSTIWYAKTGGSAQVITNALRAKLRHSNFVLLQIAGYSR